MLLTPTETIQDYMNKGWWVDQTVNDMFDTALKNDPTGIALVDPPNRDALDGTPQQKLSWRDLDAAIDRVATAFLKAGLKKDDRVLVQLPNTVDAVIIFLACSRLGLIVSPTVMQYRQHELRHIVEKIEPSAMVTLPEFSGFAHGDMAAKLADDAQGFEVFLSPDLLATEPDRDAIDSYQSSLSLDPADILTICWTSGTESRSKGVPRCHAHWVLNADVIVDATEMVDGDVLLNPFPLVNIGSIGGLVLPWLQLGSKLVLHHPFDIGIFLQQIQEESVTYTIAPPAVLGALLKQPQLMERFDISSLRAVASGSAPLSPWLIETWKSEHDIDITNVFGSNEGSSLFSSPKTVPDPKERARYFPRFGAAGLNWSSRASETMQTRLVDPNTEKTITEPGQVGELRLSGATIFSGYWNSPELNKTAFDDEGYYKTGDLFEIAGDGPLSRYYSFVGRSKEIIVRGGVNISPAELDDLIVAHPDIAEAATVGVPDDHLGERVAVAVVPVAGKSLELTDISEWLKEQGTAIFKRPEFFVQVDKLPRNAMNKVQRDVLRETVLERL